MDHHGKSSEKRFPSREERVLFRKRLFELARPSYPHLAGILLLGMVSVPLSMLMPLPLKIAVDSVIGNQPLPRILDRLVPAGLASSTTEKLIVVLVILVGLAVLSNLQTLASWLLQTYTGERLVFELRNRLFWHAQRLSLATHDRRGVNDIAYRIQHDSPAIQYIFIQGILPLVTAALTFMGMFYVVARIDRSIAVVALVISPALMIAARRSGYRVRRAWHRRPACPWGHRCGFCQRPASRGRECRDVQRFGREEDALHEAREPDGRDDSDRDSDSAEECGHNKDGSNLPAYRDTPVHFDARWFATIAPPYRLYSRRNDGRDFKFGHDHQDGN